MTEQGEILVKFAAHNFSHRNRAAIARIGELLFLVSPSNPSEVRRTANMLKVRFAASAHREINRARNKMLKGATCNAIQAWQLRSDQLAKAKLDPKDDVANRERQLACQTS